MTGSYVSRLDAGDQISASFSASPDVYVVMQIRYEDALESSEYQFRITSSGGATLLCNAIFTDSGDLRPNSNSVTGGVYSSGIGADETAWIKIAWEAGSGTDGVCKVTHYNSGWGAYVSVSNSPFTDDGAELIIRNTQDGTGVEYWYHDQIFVFSTDYTGDPNDI